MQPPSNPEVEQAVISVCLWDHAAAEQAAGSLVVSDFYDATLATVFNAVLSVLSSGGRVDMLTVSAALRSSESLADVGGAAYLAELVNDAYTAANLSQHIRILRDCAMARDLLSTAHRIATMATKGGDVQAAIDASEAAVMAIRQRRGLRDVPTVGQMMADVKRAILLRSQGETLDVVQSGFSELDAMVPGFRPGELVILAARPAMGKSLLASNMVVNAASGGKGVAFFSLEMGADEIQERMLASVAGIHAMKLTRGMVHDHEWPAIDKAADWLGRLPIHLDDEARATPQTIKAKCRRIKGLGLVVIDYLGLMGSGERSENRVQEVSRITRALKIMAKELGVPVIALSQLNRGSAQRTEHRPELFDLRDSGSIEQDADVVLFLHREAYYTHDPSQTNQAEIIVAKQRRGPTGTASIFYDPATCTFKDHSFEASSPAWANEGAKEDVWTV